MKPNTILFLALIVMGSLISCQNNQKIQKQDDAQTNDLPKDSTSSKLDVSGIYVSPDYEKKSEGYDWVSVQVTNTGDDKINIAIKSRADIKKPTCTFEGSGIKVKDGVYACMVKDTAITFTFTSQNVTIGTEKQEDEGLLSFYCSGGASLKGVYSKTNLPDTIETYN